MPRGGGGASIGKNKGYFKIQGTANFGEGHFLGRALCDYAVLSTAMAVGVNKWGGGCCRFGATSPRQ